MSRTEEPIRKPKGGYYTKYRKLYVECMFDAKVLLVKMNLPMRVPPGEWHVREYSLLPKAIGLSLGQEILVHKGGAKKHATKEWFQSKYYDNSRRAAKWKLINPLTSKWNSFRSQVLKRHMSWVYRNHGNVSQFLIVKRVYGWILYHFEELEGVSAPVQLLLKSFMKGVDRYPKEWRESISKYTVEWATRWSRWEWVSTHQNRQIHRVMKMLTYSQSKQIPNFVVSRASYLSFFPEPHQLR